MNFLFQKLEEACKHSLPVVVLSHFLPPPPLFPSPLPLFEKKGEKEGGKKGKREIEMGRRGTLVGVGSEGGEKGGGEGRKVGESVVFWGFGESEVGVDVLVKCDEHLFRMVSQPFL